MTERKLKVASRQSDDVTTDPQKAAESSQEDTMDQEKPLTKAEAIQAERTYREDVKRQTEQLKRQTEFMELRARLAKATYEHYAYSIKIDELMNPDAGQEPSGQKQDPQEPILQGTEQETNERQ